MISKCNKIKGNHEIQFYKSLSPEAMENHIIQETHKYAIHLNGENFAEHVIKKTHQKAATVLEVEGVIEEYDEEQILKKFAVIAKATKRVQELKINLTIENEISFVDMRWFQEGLRELRDLQVFDLSFGPCLGVVSFMEMPALGDQSVRVHLGDTVGLLHSLKDFRLAMIDPWSISFDIQKFCRGLRKLASLQNFSFCFCFLEHNAYLNKDFQNVVQVLKKLPSLRNVKFELHFDLVEFINEATGLLLKCLEEFVNLEEITLNFHGKKEAMNFDSNELSIKLIALKTLQLTSEMTMENDLIQSLSQVLPNLKNLENLSLNFYQLSNITDTTMRSFEEALKCLPNLREIQLTFNFQLIEFLNKKALSNLLSSFKNLVQLEKLALTWLENACVVDAGIPSLSDALGEFKLLKNLGLTLYLPENTQHLPKLFQQLQNLTSLSQLSLFLTSRKSRNLSNQEVESVCQLLNSLSSLEHGSITLLHFKASEESKERINQASFPNCHVNFRS